MNRRVDPKVASSASKKISLGTVTTANSSNLNIVTYSAPPGTGIRSKEVQKAVYAYVQAVRALGRTEVVVSDIANALAIPQASVIQALTSLRNKGIKFA